MGLDQIAESRKWHPKEISGYSLLATSIMEFMRRQKLEQELRVFQNRYEMASQAGQVGVWDWGIEDNRIFLDGTIKAMAGYSNTDTFDSLEDWESVFVMDQKAKWVD